MQAAPRPAAARARPLVLGWPPVLGWPLPPSLAASTVPACGDPLPVMTVLAYGADTAPTVRERADRSQNAFGADLIEAAGAAVLAAGAHQRDRDVVWAAGLHRR